MQQRDLFEPSPGNAFDGKTYEATRDHARLKGQLHKVFELMRDGQWRTIPAIAHVVGGSPQAISARLRDLRKEKYGRHVIERRYLRDGLFIYRVRL